MEHPVVAEPAADELDLYPAAAYEFVQRGLAYTVARVFGPALKPGLRRHVTGQQLCHGLRELATKQWGYLAQTVLRRWKITSTLDFGRIVFSLVSHQAMSTTPDDTIDDFRNVYDFTKAFESAYRVPTKC
jgi:uncharacterized repeat protein (TIGR04138 family)